FETVLLPFNDEQGSVDLLQQAGDRLAAVLIETTQGSAGVIPGSAEYLHALQRTAREQGTLLIVDEVMTSRLAWPGASHALGLQPDLITLGKYLGGGLSFGAFGGRAELMARFDPSRPDALPHAGTFNNNVLTMAAGVAGLTDVLSDERIDDLNARGDRLRAGLNEVVNPHGWIATGSGSMVGLHPVSGPVSCPQDLAEADDRLRELLFLDLLERGYYMARRGFIALSLEITDEDVDGFIDAVRDSLAHRA
ncbi:MAG: aspartate aminotransferase family protein, partial [Actinomycetales bacterium mxb001]